VSLRRRLWLSIAAAVAISIALALVAGGLLVRRQLVTSQRTVLTREADLVARAPGAPGVRAALLAQGVRLRVVGVATAEEFLPASAAAAVAAGRPADGTTGFGRRQVMFAARPIGGSVAVLTRSDGLDGSAWRPFLRIFLVTAVIGIAVAAVAAALAAKRITVPIGQVADAARRLASGDGHQPVPVTGGGELAALATTFNDMADQLDRAREAQRQFLLSVSHELKTPLTSIRGYAEGLADGAVEVPEASAVIERESTRLERLVTDLLDLARLDQRTFSVRAAPVDLGAAATQAVAAHAARASELGVRLEATGGDDAWAMADADRVGQILENLVENAIRCTPEGGLVTVSAAGGRLAVVDTGRGLAAADLPHAFERFYLHDRYGRDRQVGTGLGLAIVRELAVAMGGAVAVASEPGSGTTFTVTLPGVSSGSTTPTG
jgi:two-component system OmpR family sensor kinase